MRIAAILLLISIQAQAQQSPHIHIDQFGYLNDAEKVAVLSNPSIGFNSNLSYSPPNFMSLKDAQTNSTVYSGPIQLWDSGNVHTLSGDAGWWFDFSTFVATGEYYVFDSVNNERSASFWIHPDPYREVLKAVGRMFYYNRCGIAKDAQYAGIWSDATSFNNALQDGECYPIYDSTNTTMERDYSGGWYDAGDYNKYVSFAFRAVHDLLTAYEENPSAFGDDWNIPESGNGIPDIIDEIKWETDWLLKMVEPNGAVPIKVGSKNYSDNSQSPASANQERRFYGPYCSSASISAASMLAHAGIVMKQFPSLSSYVSSLETKAQLAYDYATPFFFNNTFQTNCDDFSIVSGDADVDTAGQINRFLTASIYMWQLTGIQSNRNLVDFNYFISDAYIAPWYDAYNMYLVDAFIRYANDSTANPSPAGNIGINLNTAASATWNDVFGWNELDLYRAYAFSWTYSWGSNNFIANYGTLNQTFFNNNIGIGGTAYKRKAAEQLHYFHGVNPLGLVFLTNMNDLGASKSCNEMYHQWFADGTDFDNAQSSPKGPPPGYLVGGVNEYYSVSTNSPPYGQPAMKAYKDFNSSWPDNSWEVSEPAIYYQAAYLRLLANFVTGNQPLSISEVKKEMDIKIYPNPTKNILFIKGEFAEGKILNIQGQEVKKFNSNYVDLSALGPGFYLIKLWNIEGNIFTEKIIKQ